VNRGINSQFVVTHFLLVAVALCFAVIDSALADQRQTTLSPQSTPSFFANVVSDYRRHYTSPNFTNVLMALGVSAVFANTPIDSEVFQEHLRSELYNEESNDLLRSSNELGDYAQLTYAIPVYLSAMWLGSAFAGEQQEENIVALWGNRALRTIVLGAPQQFILTSVTGSHRPYEGESRWSPFNDNNGVSGHAFFGAVPLLTAARLTTHPFARYSLYAVSTLPGLARVNKNKHYMSQVVMGWTLAYLSSASVFGINSNTGANIGVFANEGGVSIGVKINF
jgi:hypothetical protein